MQLNENKLARALSEQGRKKSWLAEALDVDRSTITRWVKGETTPRHFRKAEIARLLGLPVKELF